MENLLHNLKHLLQKDERLVSEGELLKNKIIELAFKLDKDLIKLLLYCKKMKQIFFADVDGTLVFDKDKFVRFISNKQFLPDSYTAFKNKIGLTVEDEYLSEKKEVVLSWPYKDCVLEGGMTKENQRRDEIFWNEILAQDEISRLFDPKVFTNAKRIDKKGKHKLNKFKIDENGNIKDNLIIKGNNLLALHSLKKRFAGKIKLIYIDPPYNKDADAFYNDSFKQSSWLTFMKNRLELARDLLKNNGFIAISISEKNLAKLKQLADEIFGEANITSITTIQVATTASYRSINICPVNVAEYLLIYSKSINDARTNKIYIESDYSEDYSHFVKNYEDNPSKWQLVSLDEIIYKHKGVKNWREFKEKFGIAWKKKRLELKKEFAFNNKERIVSLNTLQKPSKKIVDVIDKSKNNRNKIFVFSREEKSPIYIYNGRTLAFFSSKFRDIADEIVPTEILTNIWDDISFLGLGTEGGVDLPNGKKPEKLIQRLIDLIIMDKNDIVIDFFLGCGTTVAVVHKNKLQYVGVEQLDYGKNSAEIRLKNVINGDPTGISKAVDWKGGGDFVYLELMKWNENFVENIQKAKTKEELKKLWETMKNEAFLSYKVDIKTVDKNAKDFADLSIEDQKRFLFTCLEKNHLYVNYSEVDDKDYGVSDKDKSMNKEFYG